MLKIKTNKKTYNGTYVYDCLGNIIFRLKNISANMAKKDFVDIDKIEIIDSENCDGIYDNLEFFSATIYIDTDDIEINMRVLSKEEILNKELQYKLNIIEQTQQDQDDAIIEIAEVLFEGEE